MVRTNIIRKLLKTHLQKAFGLRSGQFPGIDGNAGNHGKDGNFIKVTKYLTKQKETLINMFGENITSKNTKNKIFHRFLII